MKVLMLSYDRQLENLDSETTERHIAYASYIERLDVIIPSEEPDCHSKENTNLLVHRIKLRFKPLLWRDIWRYADWLSGNIKHEVIVSQDALLGILALPIRRKYGCKLVVNMFGTEFLRRQNPVANPTRFLYRLIMRYVAKRADMIRVDYENARVEISNKLHISPDKIEVAHCIPSGIEQFENVDGSEFRTKLLSNKHDKLILYVGVLEKVKNVAGLLKAMSFVLKVYPKTLLIIIGDGLEGYSLEELSKVLDISKNVKFLGSLPHKDLPCYYAACDFTVLPSFSEGLARVLLEAAYSAKPTVITSTANKSRFVIGGETGRISITRSPARLANEIFAMLNNNEKTQQMGQEAYKRVKEQYDFETNAKKLIKVWEGAIGN